MAYDHALADRIRAMLLHEPGIAEKAMFGGLAFLYEGKMSVAAFGGGGLLVRCEPSETDALVARPHVGPFEMRGRSMRGWVRVDAEAVEDDAALREWVARGVNVAQDEAGRA